MGGADAAYVALRWGLQGSHTLADLIVSHGGAELSGPVLQNDPQPFENFPKIVKILKKKKRLKSHVVAVHF